MTPRWMTHTLTLAGVYNILWGSFVVAFPTALFAWAGMEAPRYPQIWQCVGMMVGVFGVGYLVAADRPGRHWPVVGVGLLGKIFGPVGFVLEAAHGRLPWKAGWVIVTNDLIWWIPFALILWHCLKPGEGRSESTPGKLETAGIFPLLLGPSWKEVHEAIRDFHSGVEPTWAAGVFDVRRGEGRVARLLANLFGLPPTGRNVRTTLDIRPCPEGETWCRRFEGHALESDLMKEGEELVERFPGGQVHLLASVHSGGLQLRSSRFCLRLGSIRIRLPRRMAPRVEASIRAASERSLSVRVRLDVPGVGSVLAYQGELRSEGR